MKTSSDTSGLDSFIKEVLKAPDTNLPIVDWSEVEVLLRREQKPISLNADKKIIWIAASALVIIIAGIIISQTIHFDHASSTEEVPSNEATPLTPPDESHPDWSQQASQPVDTQKTTTTAPALVDSSKIDSVALGLKKQKGNPVIIPIDTASKKITPKQDKKKKVDTTQNTISPDTASTKTNAQPVITDTAKKTVQENPVIPDTTSKKLPPANKKKPKSKKTSPSPEPVKPEVPAEIKSDSLKQQ